MQKNDETNKTTTIFRELALALIQKDSKRLAYLLDDNIEWTMMPNMHKLSGKKFVVKFLTDAWVATTKTPEVLNDVATAEWGVFEYFNKGTVTSGLTDTAKAAGLLSRFPKDPSTLVGQKYTANPVCFVYHINSNRKIDIVREYFDVGNVVNQFK